MTCGEWAVRRHGMAGRARCRARRAVAATAASGTVQWGFLRSTSSKQAGRQGGCLSEGRMQVWDRRQSDSSRRTAHHSAALESGVLQASLRGGAQYAQDSAVPTGVRRGADWRRRPRARRREHGGAGGGRATGAARQFRAAAHALASARRGRGGRSLAAN
ncbi:hypothetical protein B0J12DRAFT_767 [Macrophomina phaseolina]|uniref:Uncharacterized protein n=1 Tax=Macrophomina phaseolina TaxID=35725 RepID=A0ABQ8GU69_9PEZI|nr:hypothetical protein B0J12DRAFT_767 [Macrophomina phaseolina]